MKRPTTPEEVRVLHKILRKDPQQYLQITTEHIKDDPNDSHAYFGRHFGWMKIGEPTRSAGGGSYSRNASGSERICQFFWK